MFPPMYGMEQDPELHPRYHMGDNVVFLKKSTDEVTHIHSTEISRKNSNASYETPHTNSNDVSRKSSIASENMPVDIAQINNGLSNKYKVIVAAMACGATVSAALISALVTYFTKC